MHANHKPCCHPYQGLLDASDLSPLPPNPGDLAFARYAVQLERGGREEGRRVSSSSCFVLLFIFYVFFFLPPFSFGFATVPHSGVVSFFCFLFSWVLFCFLLFWIRRSVWTLGWVFWGGGGVEVGEKRRRRGRGDIRILTNPTALHRIAFAFLIPSCTTYLLTANISLPTLPTLPCLIIYIHSFKNTHITTYLHTYIPNVHKVPRSYVQ